VKDVAQDIDSSEIEFFIDLAANGKAFGHGHLDDTFDDGVTSLARRHFVGDSNEGWRHFQLASFAGAARSELEMP
jgi:hypothetical protein